MRPWAARLVPPIAVAVAVVMLDHLRHTWWPALDTWETFLLAVLGVGAGAYILSEMLMRHFTYRYSQFMHISAEVARLPSMVDRAHEMAGEKHEAEAKQAFLRQLASLARADAAALFVAEAESREFRLDLALGVPDGTLPVAFSMSGDPGDTARMEAREGIASRIEPALGEAGFAHAGVLSLHSGGETVGCLALASRQGLAPWLQWREAREMVESQVGSILRNLQLASEGRAMATLRERDRIAKEFHDSLAQSLTFINMEAKARLASLPVGDSAAVRESLESIAAAAREGYRDIRSTILDLRDEKRDGGGDFQDFLERYVKRFARETGLSAELVVEPGAVTQFPTQVEIQLLRVVQEALANVRKHAQARRVTVTLCTKKGAACVCIEDDGVGFDRAQVFRDGQGFGLVSMRERLQEIGGKLVVDTSPGLGTHVQALVPL